VLRRVLRPADGRTSLARGETMVVTDQTMLQTDTDCRCAARAREEDEDDVITAT
jgi:hypothetical protein